MKLALAEMYVQGVSTRKVAAITEQLCGFAVSSGQVSQAAQELDATLEAWRSRPLAACPYLLLDARYEKVRQGGIVQDAAVLIAVGVDAAGQAAGAGRLGGPVRDKKSTGARSCKAWSRAACGGVRLVVSDAHEGLKAARLAVLRQRALAALPVPPAAERLGLCAQAGHEGAGGRRHSGHLQRSGQSRGRRAAETGGAEVRADGAQTCRLAGRELCPKA